MAAADPSHESLPNFAGIEYPLADRRFGHKVVFLLPVGRIKGGEMTFASCRYRGHLARQLKKDFVFRTL